MPNPTKRHAACHAVRPGVLGLFSWYFGNIWFLVAFGSISQSAELQTGTPDLPTYRPVFSAHYWTLPFTVVI